MHAPFTDASSFRKLCRLIKLERPTHVINLGDWFESDAASVHPDESSHTLEDEYRHAAKQSVLLRKSAGSARLIWCLGNHDDNIPVPDPRRIPKPLRSLVHWNSHATFGPEFRKWKQLPYIKAREGVYAVGPTLWCHGWESGVDSDMVEGQQVANMFKRSACIGLVVRGHTHRPREVEPIKLRKNVPTQIFVANVGTIGPLKPDYMSRKDTSQWGAGAVVATIRGREWEARLERF